MTSPARAALLERLADLVVAVERPHPVRVAIDGRGGAGKSTLADELVAPIERRGRPVIRAEVDDFYRLEIDRRTRAGLTAEAFYGAYDHDALRRLLLEPLGPGGSRRYVRRFHDGWHEGVLLELERVAPDNAVLLLDGVFLLRPELDGHWDARIVVDIDPELGLARGVERDLALEPPEAREAARVGRVARWRQRYLPADDAYVAAVDPAARADAVVDNRDLAAPRLRLRGERLAARPRAVPGLAVEGAVMRLVLLYGPPAVGKLTVGLELAALTGFKVFHNHLTVNPLVAIFPRNSPPYSRLLREFRVRMLEEAAEAGIDLIATWAYPRNAEEAARAYVAAVESRGGRVHLVRLVCDRAALLARVGDESRRAMDKLIDPSRLEDLLDDRFQPRQLPFGESLVVDTTELSPRAAAARIAEHYDLPIVGRRPA